MQPTGPNRSASVGDARLYASDTRAVNTEGVLGRWVALARAGGPIGLVWLIALAIAAVYLVVFLVQLPQNLREVQWIGDYSSSFTVIETLVRTGPGDHTILSTSGQFLPVWFGLLTAKLPLHRQLWGITPTLSFAATALLVGWGVSQLSNRRAGAIAVLLVLVASPKALVFLLAPVPHDLAYLCAATLGAYLIWLTRVDGRSRAATLAVPPLAGVLLGTVLASDLLVGSAAVIPLGITAAMAGLRRGRRSRSVARAAMTTTLIAVPVALLTTSVMASLGLRPVKAPLELASLTALPERLEWLFDGLKVLFNGYLDSGSPGTLHPEVGAACEVVMCAALLAVLLVGLSTTFRFLRSRSTRGDAETAQQLARSLHITYWFASAISVCAAFLLTADASATVLHESYYASVLLSTAAIVPLLLYRVRAARWLILTGAAIFFAGSFAGLTSGYVNMAVGTHAASYESEILRVAKANHVSYGYGGFWEASSYTWLTEGQISVRPVTECAVPEGITLCPFYLDRVTSWYAPQQRHTFVLVDPSEGWINSAPAGLGRPLASYSFGTMQMLIYPYDVASRIGPYPG